jgi:hypothetical protein
MEEVETKVQVEAWKTFLKGRIMQEEGQNDAAQSLFDDALKSDPDNTFFLKARSIAFAHLNMPEEAIVDHLRSEYAKLAKQCVGENDKPDLWVKGLQDLQKKAASIDLKSITMDMCW